jgi:hypothetical protein
MMKKRFSRDLLPDESTFVDKTLRFCSQLSIDRRDQRTCEHEGKTDDRLPEEEIIFIKSALGNICNKNMAENVALHAII